MDFFIMILIDYQTYLFLLLLIVLDLFIINLIYNCIIFLLLVSFIIILSKSKFVSILCFVIKLTQSLNTRPLKYLCFFFIFLSETEYCLTICKANKTTPPRKFIHILQIRHQNPTPEPFAVFPKLNNGILLEKTRNTIL